MSCSSAEANKIHLQSSWRLTPPFPCKFEKALSIDPIKAVSQIFVIMFSMGMQEQFKLCKPTDFPTMVASRKMCVPNSLSQNFHIMWNIWWCMLNWFNTGEQHKWKKTGKKEQTLALDPQLCRKFKYFTESWNLLRTTTYWSLLLSFSSPELGWMLATSHFQQFSYQTTLQRKTVIGKTVGKTVDIPAAM